MPLSYARQVLIQSIQRLTQSGIGERTKSFVRGLVWLAPATLACRILSGLSSVLVARWLGPAEFGQANLSLAATYWIQVVVFLGLPAALTHHVPQVAEAEKKYWLAKGLRLQFLLAAAALGIGYLFREPLASWQGISISVFEGALLWTTGFFFYTVFSSIVTSEEHFRDKALGEILFTLFFVGGLAWCWKAGCLSSSRYIGLLALAYTLAAFFYGRKWLRYLLVSVPKSSVIAPSLLRYGLLSAVGLVANALLQSPARLIAHRYLPLEQVGILAAYQNGSVQMAMFVIGIITPAFFPIASRTPDKVTLMQKISRLLLMSVPAAFLVFAATLWLYLTILGKNYPMPLSYILIFACVATLTFVNSALAWTLASFGPRGVLAFSLISCIAGGINLWLCLLLIPTYGVIGSGLAAIGGLTIGSGLSGWRRVRQLL